MAINVGVIGYGASGSTFHVPLIQSTKNLCLKAIVSSKESIIKETLPDVDILANINDLLARQDIELIIITSPNTTHYDFAKQAIFAGKNVVVEKPFTITSREARELIDFAKKKNVILTVFHNRRWDSDFLTLQEVLKSGTLGNISTYESHYDRFRPNVRDRWREWNISGAGILYDLGSHLIDQALMLFGLPQSLWADVRIERKGALADDYFHLVLNYKNLKVILHSSSLVYEAGPKLMVHGDKGSFIYYGLDAQEDQLKNGLRPSDADWGKSPTTPILKINTGSNEKLNIINGSYEEFYNELATAIDKKTPPPVDAKEALQTIRMIEYALKSSKEKRAVAIEQESLSYS